MAWTFARLRLQGVCRCLNNVDEVNCPRFLFVCIRTTINNNLKHNDYEETTIIIRDHVAAIGG
jgi:hypothetical protein